MLDNNFNNLLTSYNMPTYGDYWSNTSDYGYAPGMRYYAWDIMMRMEISHNATQSKNAICIFDGIIE